MFLFRFTRLLVVWHYTRCTCMSQVRADTGENRGFLFPAAGTVQNDETVSSFGGVVYSSSRDSLRIWTPASPGPGYLLYINNDWGNSMYPQSSKTATLVVHVWKSASCKFGYSSLVPRHRRCRRRAAKFSPMLGTYGIFLVQFLLFHGDSVFAASSEGPPFVVFQESQRALFSTRFCT